MISYPSLFRARYGCGDPKKEVGFGRALSRFECSPWPAFTLERTFCWPKAGENQSSRTLVTERCLGSTNIGVPFSGLWSTIM